MSKYKNGVKIVRFPGGRVARFHKPGTKAAAKGAAKKRAAGRMLAKKFGFAKRSRSRRRNPFRAETYVRKYKHDMLRAARYSTLARHGRGGRKLHPKSRRLRERRAKVLRETKMLKRHFRINPDNIRTGRPRAVRAPDFIYHSRTPASLRNKWVVIGTDYGYLHNSGGEIRTWDTRSGAAKKAKELRSYASNPRGHRGSRKKSRSPARRLLNRKREFGFQEATANRWARAMDETDANRVFLRAMKKSKVTKRYKRSRGMKNPRRNPQEAFNVYRKGRLIDTVFATGYTADEMKRSLINHDGYPSDIRVTKRKAKR